MGPSAGLSRREALPWGAVSKGLRTLWEVKALSMLCPSLGAALLQGRAAETFLSRGGRRTCGNGVQWFCCWEEAAGLGEPWLLCPLCVALVSQGQNSTVTCRGWGC